MSPRVRSLPDVDVSLRDLESYVINVDAEDRTSCADGDLVSG